jgi:hypothetical protein
MIGIKTLILTVMVTMIAAMMFGAVLGQMKSDQQAAEIPTGLLTALQNDLKDELKDADECLPLKDHLSVSRFDLIRHQEVWLVEGRSGCLAGANNGTILLYTRADNGWRKILDDVGQYLTVCAQADPPCLVPSRSKRRSSSTHGWPDLARYGHASASEGNQLMYRFDGKV